MDIKIKKDKKCNSCCNNKSESQFPFCPEDIHIKFVKLRQDNKMFYQIMETHVQNKIIDLWKINFNLKTKLKLKNIIQILTLVIQIEPLLYDC